MQSMVYETYTVGPPCGRVAHFGSNANNGTNAGSFYWNLNNASSNRNRNIGTHLAEAFYAA